MEEVLGKREWLNFHLLLYHLYMCSCYLWKILEISALSHNPIEPSTLKWRPYFWETMFNQRYIYVPAQLKEPRPCLSLFFIHKLLSLFWRELGGMNFKPRYLLELLFSNVVGLLFYLHSHISFILIILKVSDFFRWYSLLWWRWPLLCCW